MDDVYQILVNVLVGKAVIHLELATEMFRPKINAEVIRVEDDLSPYELLHHFVCQIIANAYCQPSVDIRIGQRTKQGSLLFLDNDSQSAIQQVFTKEHVRVNIIVESVPRIEMIDKCIMIED